MTAALRFQVFGTSAARAKALVGVIGPQLNEKCGITAQPATGGPPPDIAIYQFDSAGVKAPAFFETWDARAKATDHAIQIFLEIPALTADPEIAALNAHIAELANVNGGYLIPLMSKFLRWDAARLLAPDDTLTRQGNTAVAAAIAKVVGRHLARSELKSPAADAPTAQLSAQQILAEIGWDRVDTPRFIASSGNVETVGGLLDGYVVLSHWPPVALGETIDWLQGGPNRSWQSYFLGLDFLAPAFGVYHARVRGGRTRAQFAEFLAQRNITPGDIFGAAENVLGNFLEANPPDAPFAQRAWHEGTVCHRLKVLLLYVLCCRAAQEANAPFSEHVLRLAYQSILSSVELLQQPNVYLPAGNHGFRQDALLITVGILFGKSTFGRDLLQFALDRLRREQLEKAISSDGVWLENSFGYHCMMMGQIRRLAADLEVPDPAYAARLFDLFARMTTFAEALIKPDGLAPLIGDTEPKPYLGVIRDALRDETDTAEDESGGLKRSRETYLFPDAGYFASHSTRALSPDASSVIFFSNWSTPKHKQADDLSVLFARGAQDILIDGGTYNKETSDTIRNAARYDPATHNTFRIGGTGYSVRRTKGERPAGLSGMWEGDGWAAARGFNTSYTNGHVVRFVIHLKHHHAVAVFDQLSAIGREPVLFEQFWHIAPEFIPATAPAKPSGPWVFDSASAGTLIAAFDEDEATCAVEFGGPDNPIAWLMLPDDTVVPTPYLRRARTMKNGTMASLFQWNPKPASIAIASAPRGRRQTEITMRGAGFTARFAVSENSVECLELKAD